MTLRQKTNLWFWVSIALVVVLQTMYNTRHDHAYQVEFESKLIQLNAQRLANAADQEISHLHLRHHSSAFSDGLYRYLEIGDSSYIKNYFNEQYMRTARLDFIGVLDNQQNLKFSNTIHPKTNKTESFQELGVDKFKRDSTLSSIITPEGCVIGFLHIQNGAMLYVAGPVKRGDGSGVRQGTLVMGRVVTDSLLKEFSQSLLVPLTIYSREQIANSTDLKLIEAKAEQSGSVYIDTSNPDSINGYIILRDITNQPVLLAKISSPMERQQLLATNNYDGVGNALLILLIGGSGFWVLSRALIKRTEQLTVQVKKITEFGDLSMQTEISGSDELATLSYNINQMLLGLKSAQDDLMEAERRFRNILSEVRMVGVILGVDGTILFFNRYAVEITGWEESELLGKNWFDSVAPEHDREFRRQRFLEVAVDGGEDALIEREILTKWGETRTIIIHMIALRERDGSVVAIAMIGEDITDRLMAEAEIRQLATLVETAAESIEISDLNGNYVYVNPAYKEITGFEEFEVIGTPMKFDASVESALEQTRSYVWEIVNSGTVWNGHVIERHKNGNPIELDVTIVPLRDQAGQITHFGRFARDATQTAELERQLNRAQRFVAVGELTGGIAHNFNNALTVIMGNIGMARFSDKEKAQAHLSDAENACVRASDLIKQLMAFSRRTQIERKPMAIDSLLKEIHKLVLSTFDRRIEVALGELPPLQKIEGDGSQLHQVLLNMCFNAKDALNDVAGDPERTLRITISAKMEYIEDQLIDAELRSGNYVCIQVSDTGAGMTEETIKQIFEPFFTTKEVGKGTGLGLSTAFGIVKQHDGWIDVASTPGVGTEFSIFLPAMKDSAVQEHTRVDREEIRGGSEHILLVEDEELVRRVGITILERYGYKVTTARNGLEALQLLEQDANQFALILLDISMPVMSGVEFLDRVSDRFPHLLVIVSSGVPLVSADPRIGKQVMGFVAKPYQAKDMGLEIRRILDRANATQS